MIDFTLTNMQRTLQELARDFAQREIVPIAIKYDTEPFDPKEILPKAHAAGVMNMTTPKEYGGHGLSLLDASLMTEELNAACSGIGGASTVRADRRPA